MFIPLQTKIVGYTGTVYWKLTHETWIRAEIFQEIIAFDSEEWGVSFCKSQF